MNVWTVFLRHRIVPDSFRHVALSNGSSDRRSFRLRKAARQGRWMAETGF
jgi:hypothetical protein